MTATSRCLLPCACFTPSAVACGWCPDNAASPISARSAHSSPDMNRLSAKPFRLLNTRLSISGPLAQLYPTDRMEEGYCYKKKQLNCVLSQVFCCKENRLGSMRHIGSLSALAPKIKSANQTAPNTSSQSQGRKRRQPTSGKSAGPSTEKRTTSAAREKALAIPSYTMPTILVAEGFNMQVLRT